ncbi:SPOR domain-containing protein [Cohnella sp.]|uniref:SPOR domain-containing protein n=1 Tax=Cohnella sp. TaxID=1883426 RepID=UPI00356621F4
MQHKARMTFRFEPPKPAQSKKPIRQPLKAGQQPLTEDNLEKEEAVIGQSFSSWDSPYQDDIHALEEVIRSSDAKKVEESIYAPYPAIKIIPHDELEANWSGPSIELEGESQTSWLNQSQPLHDTPAWGRVFLSVTAAVATGALFGYLVLSLFTGEPLFPGKSDGSAQVNVQAPPEQSAASSTEPLKIFEDNETSVQPGVQSELTQIPADVYYMLQYGVFQSEESMKAAVEHLQEIGLDSTVEAQDGYRVYIGAAVTRNEAELLAAQMSDIELYIRPLDGDPLIIRSGSMPAGEIEFMTASAELIRKLTQYSGSYLLESLPQVMNKADLSALQEAHRTWLSKTAGVDTFSNDTLGEGERIVQALNSAVLSLTEYNRNPSRFHLWSIQSQTMKAMLADRNLRSIIQSANNG